MEPLQLPFCCHSQNLKSPWSTGNTPCSTQTLPGHFPRAQGCVPQLHPGLHSQQGSPDQQGKLEALGQRKELRNGSNQCGWMETPSSVAERSPTKFGKRDNVEWSEEQEASARSKVQENSSQLLPQDKQEEYEVNAKKYWDDFYKIHENGFFKDRHWLFTEFPELAPNRNSSQNGDSVHGFSDTEESKNEGLGSCENGHCSLETRTESQLNLIESPHGGHTEELAAQKDSELSLSDGHYPGSAASYRILEVGCGAGNTVFPILQTNNDPGLFVYCCDFSTTAVNLVQKNAEYDSSRCFVFVHDLCNDQSPFPMPEESLDIVILIFVLSAILPEKMQCIVTRLSRLLKPGGMILLRDYGRYDLAQLRFKKGQCLSDNFYVRGDGTRVYFFTQDELDHLFTTAGLEKIQNLVDRRLQVNRGKQMTMYRVWIQCKYCKPTTLQP